MSLLSKLFKKIILWMLGSNKIEPILEIASPIVKEFAPQDGYDGSVKRILVHKRVRDKLTETGKDFSDHLINLSIELALIELKEDIT